MPRRRDYSTPLPFPYAKQLCNVPVEDTRPQQPQVGPKHVAAPLGKAVQERALVKEAEEEYMKIAVGYTGRSIGGEHELQAHRHPPVREDEGYHSYVDDISADERSSSDPSTTGIISPNEEAYGHQSLRPAPANATSRPPIPDIRQIQSITRNLPPEVPPRKPRRTKDPIYEHVEGATLDARPVAGSSHKDPEEVIPEFEATDVRTIPGKRAHLSWESSFEDDESSSRSSPRSTESRHAPSPDWSRSSGSGSSTSSDTIGPKMYESKGFQQSSSQHGKGAAELDGTPSSPRNTLTPSDVASELDGEPAPVPTQTRKLDLHPIVEEDGEAIGEATCSRAAPSPAVQRAKDAEIGGRGVHTLSSTLKSAFSNSSGRPRDEDAAATQVPDPPRVVSIDGIGGDQHVYEMVPETSNQATPSQESGHSSISPTMIDTSNSSSGGSSSASSAHTGLLGHMKDGISSAAHAVHERVKKNVSFSPVNDVRFRTPSPGQSMEATSRRSSAEQRRDY